MNLEIFSRQLRLLETLTGNTDMSVDEVCAELDISPRTFHRYIAMFKAMGFEIVISHGIYTILQSSPFYTATTDKMMLRQNEVNTLARLLADANPDDSSVASLRRKFHNLYGIDFDPADSTSNPLIAENTRRLSSAVRNHKQVVLHGYTSPHQLSQTDRLVEPYRMLPQMGSVRCYEPQSDSCKTFKIARIAGDVETLKTRWQHKQKHSNYYIDPFGFAGESRRRVVLRLSMLATQVLCEEFGIKESQLLIAGDEQHRIFTTGICSPVGIGRFVMGLMGEVEIIRGEELRMYIERQIRNYHRQAGETPTLI